MSDMTLKAVLFGEDRTMGKTFQGAGRDAQQAGGHISAMGKVAGGLGGLAKGALLGFGAAALTAGGFAATMGLKTAAAGEQAGIAFSTMLGSSKKAGAFLKDLQAFAASTPFEFPELQTAASSLISAGINANKVIPIMTTLGNVTSGMGTGSEGVKRATIALQQMSAAGRITGEDLNQLRDAGIPVYDLLAKATGKSKAEVVKLAQAGKLGSKELGQMMKALETGKGLERFSGLMDKQSRSLSGLWATFKDTFQMGLAKAIEPLIPLLKDGLGRASEFLAAALPKVAAGLRWIVQAAGGLYDVLVKGDFTKRFREAFRLEEDSKVVGFLFRLRDAFVSVGDFVRTKVIPAIAAFGGWLVNDLWPALQKGYQTIMPGLRQALSIVGGAFKGGGENGKTFGEHMKAIGKVIVEKVVPFLAVLIRSYLPVLATNIRTAIEVVKILYRTFEVWKTVVSTVVGSIIRRFADLMSMFATMLRALGKVPGFGWARDAANKLQGAADKAYGLARAINAIPANKTVTVNTYFRTHGNPNPLSAVGSGAGVKGYARGGFNLPRGWRIAGEDGPELQWSPGGDSIINAKDTARILAARGSNGGSGAGAGGVQMMQPIVLQMDGRTVWQGLKALKRTSGVDLGLA